MPNPPVVLIILDGWGLDPSRENNAVMLANTPRFDALWRQYPHTQLCASGVDAGLPPGIMGNSEVGHLNLGAGRVVQQEISRINHAIDEKRFYTNDVLTSVLQQSLSNNSALHLVGLMSDGLVHSSQHHYLALLELARRRGFPGDRVFFHAILDGRDTSPKSALSFLASLQEAMAECGIGRIATVSGRYYSMDRDNRWERIHKAYDACVQGRGEQAATAEEAIKSGYERGETDEFVLPTVIMNNGAPIGPISSDDGLIFFNYRADRGRELLRTLTDTDFTEFNRGVVPELTVATMTRYDATLDVPYAFQPAGPMRNILGETISMHGRSQLRTAETEKYAHVTYFFNGGNETPFESEHRIMVPSPKGVATYDEQPEMSAPAVAWKVVRALRSEKYDFILINFANPDMVGHTGSVLAATLAVEAVDWGLGNIIDTVRAVGGRAIITADHGNAEVMVNPETGNPHTAHTSNPVPIIVVDDRAKDTKLREGGRLSDVAPTILGLMDLSVPDEMTGTDLRILYRE